jgi:hypothetical protein
VNNIGHNAKLRNLYRPPSVVVYGSEITEAMMVWVCDLEGKAAPAYQLVGQPLRKCSLERPRKRWDDSVDGIRDRFYYVTVSDISNI